MAIGIEHVGDLDLLKCVKWLWHENFAASIQKGKNHSQSLCDRRKLGDVSLKWLVHAGRQGLGNLRDLVMPPVCLSCERRIDVAGMVCPTCWSTMRFVERPFCEILGSPFSYDLGAGALSAEAIANPPAFDRARSVVLYDDVARKLIQGLKFSDRTDLAPWLARWMERAGSDVLAQSCLIVPVPLHRWRLLERRFNQSAELARPIAVATGYEYRPELLERSRRTKQQVGLKAKERARNVQGAFRVPSSQKLEVKGQRILLIDDVYTTGATLQACARALRRAGAVQIDCLTFARVATGDI